MATTSSPASGANRARRSCLAVPGSNPRFLEKAQSLPADQVFLDLEDAVRAAGEGGRPPQRSWTRSTTAAGPARPRASSASTTSTTHWTLPRRHRPSSRARERTSTASCCPRSRTPGRSSGSTCCSPRSRRPSDLPVGRIGIEAQIENARGLVNVDEIAAASPRIETIIFGPGRLHGLDQHEVAGRRRAAAGLRRRRRVPLHPDAHPDRGARQRPAGDRRPVPPDPRLRRLPPRSPRAAPRSASTASGCCTRTRSASPTRCTPRRRTTTTTPS